MPTTCCVVNCGSRAMRDNVKFFKIPTELHFAHRVDLNELSKKRRQEWINAIRRQDFTGTKLEYSRVCSKHFLTGKPSELSEENSIDWVPSVALGYANHGTVSEKVGMAPAGEKKVRKRGKRLLDDISEEVTFPPSKEIPKNDVICKADTENSEVGMPMPSSPMPPDMYIKNEDTTNDGYVNEPRDSPKICRMCMKKNITDAKNIFEDYLDHEVSIRSALESCIYSLEDSINEQLSEYACAECLELLYSFYKFKMFVLSQEKVQREFVAGDPLDLGDMKSGHKRNLDTNNEFELTKRKKTECSPDKNRLTIGLGQVEMNSETKSIQALLPGTLRIYDKPNSANCDETASNGSEHISSSKKVAEFIVHLDKNQSIVPKLKYIVLDKVAQKEMDKELPSITQEKRNENLDSTVTITNDSQTFYKNIPFCIVNGYLMEQKLLKGNIRYLKCTSAKCSATGKQEILTPGTFKNIVTITNRHNHEKPTPIEMKKLKIISAVRKRLQKTKGLSIKSIYEEFCKIDSTITHLVPIENLMDEICNL